MLKKISVLLICLAYMVLVACGTKGPLYIPEQRYPQDVKKQDVKKPAAPQANTDAPSQASSQTPN